ncbi:hypothetical protein CR513_05063, partial [Mucuna pruriens]
MELRPCATMQFVRQPWDFLITKSLMLCLMDKSNTENRALEEYGDIHMFVFDLSGVKTILSSSCLVGLHILLQTTGTQKGLYFNCYKIFTLRTR